MLAPLDAGDATARLVLRAGDTLSLSELRIQVARAGGAPVDVPPAQWSTPSAGAWRAGDTLTLPLSPAVSAGERIAIQLFHTPANARLADLVASAPATESALPAATLTAALVPASIVADASTAALLTVRVSHPMGALGIASVHANLTT